MFILFYRAAVSCISISLSVLMLTAEPIGTDCDESGWRNYMITVHGKDGSVFNLKGKSWFAGQLAYWQHLIVSLSKPCDQDFDRNIGPY